MESHRPHRPSKISIWSPTDLPQTLQSSTTDPTDLQKDYLLSIWSPTDPTDLPKLACGVPQTLQSSTADPTDHEKVLCTLYMESHRPSKVGHLAVVLIRGDCVYLDISYSFIILYQHCLHLHYGSTEHIWTRNQ